MLTSIPISRKLALAFSAVLLAAVVMVASLSVSISHVRSAIDHNETVNLQRAASAAMETAIQNETAQLRNYLITEDPQYRAALHSARASFDSAADELLPLLEKDSERALARESIATVQAWRADRADRLIAEIRSGRGAAARQHFSDSASPQRSNELTAAIQKLRADERETVRKGAEAITAATRNEKRALWVGGLMMLAISIGAWWLLSRLIGAPVSTLAAKMRQLAGGDNSVELPCARRGDEIGEMAKSMLVFRETQIAKQAADAEREEGHARQQLVMSAFQHSLVQVREGDLTSDITAEFHECYQPLKTNYNDSLTSLRSLIGAVIATIGGIRGSAGEIMQASDDLARRTESNAASLEQTSAALVQFDEHLRTTAESARRTVERADQAIAVVSAGRSITDEAVEAMGRVSDSAKGIDSVIEGLDKIAFQTRVLAMNAAVEAGRAGEAGRGFAVVADLVSALAMRAEEEAKRARDQLTAAQTDIGTAVERVQRVDGALADISGDVGEVHQLVGRMADDNQSQAAAISQITTAISAMDQSTQQNAAMVEQTSAAVRTLTADVDALSQQTGRFKTGSGHAVAPVRPSPHKFEIKAPTPAPLRTLSRAAPVTSTVNKASTLVNEDWTAF